MSVSKGRSPRSHMWLWLVSALMANILIGYLFKINETLASKFSLPLVVAELVSFVVVGIRRLNDINRKTAWILIGFVPILNLGLGVVLLFRKSAVAMVQEKFEGTQDIK
jgi:uncharacterized membrane protein YhaH (DUF805 family)